MSITNLLGNSTTLMILICMGVIAIGIVSNYDKYNYNKNLIMWYNNKTVKEILDMHTDRGHILNKYIIDNDIKDRLYDRLTISVESTSYFEWLRNGGVNLEVTGVVENTETIEMDNLVVNIEIINDQWVYAIGGLKFAVDTDSEIITGTETSIKVAYAEDQKKDGIIEDYTVVYQKMN